MLAKLNVQRKLTLLLMLPFFAILLTGIPFAIGQVNTAIAAGAAVDTAEKARLMGILVQDLQQERLLGLSYLVTTDADRTVLITATANTTDSAQDVLDVLSLPEDAKIKTAIAGLSSLTNLRQSVLDRSATKASVYEMYHSQIVQLVDSLELTQKQGTDSTGLRQLSLLDSLLRTNEGIAQVGAGLVYGSVDETSAAEALVLVARAELLRDADANRFRQQASTEENILLNLVEQGPTGRKINSMASALINTGERPTASAALTAASTMVTLTKVQQERIARSIAVEADTRANNAQWYAGLVIGGALVLILIVIGLSLAVSRSVSVPLRRLTRAAREVADVATNELVRVADSEIERAEPPKLAAVEVLTQDEIGDMAEAFNQVQITAGKLMEQQIATRRNTAVMFANIARRTRSMVSRQLTFIDDLERNEQNERLLAKLYRLDHLTTRLHRSADSLLVVSGAREDARIVSPAPLADVVRSAVAEIEGYQNVQTGALPSVIVAPQLVPDLRLVLAELLENATAFSPPGSPVELSASVEGTCRIVIVDHGIGMSDERLAEENERLLERERLDVVPTSVLGLFVVGRLARRHSLHVELSRSGEQGVTATVTVPEGLFHDPSLTARPVAAEAEQAEQGMPGPAPSVATLEALASASILATKPPAEEPSPAREAERAAALEAQREARLRREEVARRQAEREEAAKRAEAERAEAERVVAEKIAAAERAEAERAEAERVVAEKIAAAERAEAERAEAERAQAERLATAEQAEAERAEAEREEAEREEAAQRAEAERAAAEQAEAERLAIAERAEAESGAEGRGQPEPEAQAEGEEPGFGWFVAPPDLPTAPPMAGTVPPDTERGKEPPGPSAPRHAGEPEPELEVRAEEAAEPVKTGGGAAHRGLTRRQPGGHLPSFGFGDDDFKGSPVTRDAAAERAELEAFTMGTAQAAAARLKRAGLEIPEPQFEAPQVPTRQRLEEAARREPAHVGAPSTQVDEHPADTRSGGGQASGHGGLTRRMPGTHLSEYLRSTGPRQAVPSRSSSRDADAERAALESFIDGLARAQATPDQDDHS